MFNKIFSLITIFAVILLLLFTFIFGFLGELDRSLLCFIIALECLILVDVEDLNRKVEGK